MQQRGALALDGLTALFQQLGGLEVVGDGDMADTNRDLKAAKVDLVQIYPNLNRSAEAERFRER